MKIITRAEWGARPPTKPFTKMVLPSPNVRLHHSAGPSLPGIETIRKIQIYHQDTKGWKDIAYNFLIDGNGVPYEGRGAGIIGGATEGHNTDHAICLLGNFEAERPTPAAEATLRELLHLGMVQGWWKPYLWGHRDTSDTLCPGLYLYEMIPGLRTAFTIPTQTPKEEIEMLLIQRGTNGPVLLLSGSVTVLIENTTELTTHRNAGIKTIQVGDKQFARYEELQA